MNSTQDQQRFPQRTRKAASTKQRILEAATDLFLNEGFSQTSLDRVAEVAETTKPTVYSHFKSKHGLFEAVVEQNAKGKLETLKHLLIPTNDPESDLHQFGDTFLPRVLSPQTQCWDRLAAAESINHPEVGEAFYKAGPARLMKKLTGYLKTQSEAGLLHVEKPERAAEQLIGLMLGVDILRTQIGQKPPGIATLKKRCREAVAVFLAAYGAKR